MTRQLCESCKGLGCVACGGEGHLVVAGEIYGRPVVVRHDLPSAPEITIENVLAMKSACDPTNKRPVVEENSYERAENPLGPDWTWTEIIGPSEIGSNTAKLEPQASIEHAAVDWMFEAYDRLKAESPMLVRGEGTAVPPSGTFVTPPSILCDESVQRAKPQPVRSSQPSALALIADLIADGCKIEIEPLHTIGTQST